jgi:diguanylate cyclase (GGDEF)-like protein
MQAALREYDTIARWGGDEFVIIVEDLDSDFQTSLQRAQNIAANLLQALRKPYTYKGRTFVCHPSIGVACFRGVMQPVQQVIDDADHAMYQAKLAGKNRVHINCNPPDDTLNAKRSENVAA